MFAIHAESPVGRGGVVARKRRSFFLVVLLTTCLPVVLGVGETTGGRGKGDRGGGKVGDPRRQRR